MIKNPEKAPHGEGARYANSFKVLNSSSLLVPLSQFFICVGDEAEHNKEESTLASSLSFQVNPGVKEPITMATESKDSRYMWMGSGVRLAR